MASGRLQASPAGAPLELLTEHAVSTLNDLVELDPEARGPVMANTSVF